jgi:hypothetical protein
MMVETIVIRAGKSKPELSIKRRPHVSSHV